jgi:molecular chaperone GrpE (heat shock protein)
VKEREAETTHRNKIIHEKRVRLTEDFKRNEQVWVEAKKKSEANRQAIIHSFAASLVAVGKHFNKTKALENDSHSVDLREGFDNTSRLFFNTLEKFKIRVTEVEAGVKSKSKDQFDVVGQEKAEQESQKDTVARVVEQGWEADGKTIIKPKVILFQ